MWKKMFKVGVCTSKHARGPRGCWLLWGEWCAHSEAAHPVTQLPKSHLNVILNIKLLLRLIFWFFYICLKKNVILLSHGNWKRRHLMFSFCVNAGWRWNISWISQFSVLSCVSPAGSWSVKAAALRHPLRFFTDLSHRPVSICRHIYCRLLSQISSSEPKNLTDAVLQFQLWARFSEK